MMFGIIEETLGRERWFPALLTGTFVTRVSAKTRKHATLFMPDVPRNLCRILRVSSAEPSSQETNFEADLNVLANIIPANGYVHGEKPTCIDAGIYGFIANIFFYDIDTPLKQFVVSAANMVRHCRAIHDVVMAHPRST